MTDKKVNFTLGATDKTKRAFDAVTNRLKMISAASLLVAGGITAATKQSLSFADTIGKVSVQAGVTTDFLQEARFAFDKFGISTAQTDQALVKLNRRIGLAAKEGGAAMKPIRDYGIAIRDTNGDLRDSQAIFKDVATLIGRVESPAEKSAIASQFFGEEVGPKLAAALADGGKAMDEWTEKAKSLGIIIDSELIKGAEEANDKLSMLSAIIKARTTESLLNLAPLLSDVSDGFVTLSRAFSGWTLSIDDNWDSAVQLSNILETLLVKRQMMTDVLGMPIDHSFGGLAADIERVKDRLAELTGENNKPLRIDFDIPGLTNSQKQSQSFEALFDMYEKAERSARMLANGQEVELKILQAKEKIIDALKKKHPEYLELSAEKQRELIGLTTEQQERLEQIIRRTAGYKKKGKDTFDTIKDATEGWGDQLADTLAKGEADFSNFTRAVLADIAQILARQAVAGLVAQAFGGGGTAGSTAAAAASANKSGGITINQYNNFEGDTVADKTDQAELVKQATQSVLKDIERGGVAARIVGRRR